MVPSGQGSADRTARSHAPSLSTQPRQQQQQHKNQTPAVTFQHHDHHLTFIPQPFTGALPQQLQVQQQQAYPHQQQQQQHVQQTYPQRPQPQQQRFPAADLELEGYSYYDGPTPQYIRNDTVTTSRHGSLGNASMMTESSTTGSGSMKRRHNAPMHMKYHPYLSTGFPNNRGTMRSIPPTPTETLDNLSLGAVFEHVGGNLATATADTINPDDLSSKPGSGASTVSHSRRESLVPAVQVDLSDQFRQYELLRQRASFASSAQQSHNPAAQLHTTLTSEQAPGFDLMMDGEDVHMSNTQQGLYGQQHLQGDPWRIPQQQNLAAQLMRSIADLNDRPLSSTLGSDFDLDPPDSPQFGAPDWGSTGGNGGRAMSASLDWHPLSRQVTHVRSPSVMSSASSRREAPTEGFLTQALKEASTMTSTTPPMSHARLNGTRRPSMQTQNRHVTADVQALVGQYTAAAVAKASSASAPLDAAAAAKARQDYELATEDLFAANQNLFEYGPFEDISLQYDMTGSSTAGGPAGAEAEARRGHRPSISSLSVATDESSLASANQTGRRQRQGHRGSTTLQLLTEAALAAGVDNPAAGLPSRARLAQGQEEGAYATLFGTQERELYGPYDAGSPGGVSIAETHAHARVGVGVPGSAGSTVTLSANQPLSIKSVKTGTGAGAVTTAKTTTQAGPVMNAQGSIRIERLPPKAKVQENLVPPHIEDMTVAQLKNELRRRGLLATGKKEELRERLAVVWGDVQAQAHVQGLLYTVQ